MEEGYIKKRRILFACKRRSQRPRIASLETDEGGKANDIRPEYEERKTATREGVAVYKQANRDKSPKVTYSVPAV